MTDAHGPETAGPRTQDADPTPLPVDAAARAGNAIIDNVKEVIVGHHDEIEHVLTAVLADGHVLVEDVPGVGKTMLARALSRSIDCSFSRVQFTPDLLPADITGVNVFNQKSREFEFRSGPVFANFVLGDEINRAPPKTQSALLEAMAERQVTVDGDTRRLPDPFTVVATQNTVEGGRTYELPMAEVDRFTKKIHLGYPDQSEEVRMLDRVVGGHPIEELEPVTDVDTVRRARATASAVTVNEPIREYASRLADYTRENARLGVSPRGSIALLRSAQARAVLDGRDYVVPDDVQSEAPTVLAHRVRVADGDARPEAGARVVGEALESVPVE